MRKIPLIERRRQELVEQEKLYCRIFDLLDAGTSIAEVARQTGFSRFWIYQLRENPEARPINEA